MALTKREQWLGNNLADAFKLPFVDVEDWMLLEDTQSHLRTLFSGAGPSKLLVYYQPHDRQTDVSRPRQIATTTLASTLCKSNVTAHPPLPPLSSSLPRRASG